MSDLLAQAVAAHRSGRLVEAEALYRALLKDDPRQADAWALLGLLLAGQERGQDAAACVQTALSIDPSSVLFHFYMGNVQAAVHCFSDAASSYRRAVDLAPDYAQAWLALADTALRSGETPTALQASERATVLMPQHPAAWAARAIALEKVDREEDAVSCLERAIGLRPDFIEAWDMLGTTLQKLNRLDEADKIMRQAICLAGKDIADEETREVDEAEYGVQHWNLALLELLRGDFKRGFAHYRARFRKPGRPPRLSYPRRLWRGEDLRGQKILLVGEQGFGDVLQMARFIPLLKEQGATTVLLVHEALRGLFDRSGLADQVIAQAPDSDEDYAFQASLFDLPHRLGTRLDTIPSAPYIPVLPPDAATFLAETGRGKKIGVAWAGRPDFGDDRRRSIPLSVFRALFAVPGCAFYGLARDLKSGEKEILDACGVSDLSGRLTDYAATARFVAQMDIIVSCDTSVAHLAGAIGKPVWILLPFAPDWRWQMDRSDSLWYPTARLFRQEVKADWTRVVDRVAQALM